VKDSQSLLVTKQLFSTEPAQIVRSSSVAAVVGAAHTDQAAPRRCVGLDLGKKTKLCEISGERIINRATLVDDADFKALLGPHTEPARIALEAGRSAWYYHDLLTSWGHQVLVVDTTRVRSLGIGNHRRKNDRIDAEVLARAVVSGRIPLAHVLSPERRVLRARINIRRSLVQTRSSMIITIRGLLRSWGVPQPKCDTDNFANKIEAYRDKLLAEQYDTIKPLLMVLKTIAPELKAVDENLDQVAKSLDVAQVLMTCPGVGPILSCSFISVIDEADRFKSAHQVESYLGLVPSERTSGKRKLGAITKAGNPYLRALLVQAAWNVMRRPDGDPLKCWGQSLAKKRDKRVAAVAVARRLAGILWAMWRDGAVYDAQNVGRASSRGMRAQANRVAHTAQQIAQAS
jgi:transposase